MSAINVSQSIWENMSFKNKNNNNKKTNKCKITQKIDQKLKSNATLK